MFEPIPAAAEIRCQELDQRQILSAYFKRFYLMQVENQLIPDAAFENKNGIERYFTGIPMVYNNAVSGLPEACHWNECIEEQLNYFKEADMPFVWYLEEEADPEFKKKLLDYGFQEGGIFRGVMGVLNKPIPAPEISKGCTLELVENEAAMAEFNSLVCQTFGYTGVSEELCGKFLIDANKNKEQPMLHWLARKEGKVVSALSTLINGGMVSFWNGATLPEVRRQGLSTALRRLALRDAISRGCCIGTSYLMSEGLAFGICSKFGYQTKWRINVFLSPKQ